MAGEAVQAGGDSSAPRGSPAMKGGLGQEPCPEGRHDCPSQMYGSRFFAFTLRPYSLTHASSSDDSAPASRAPRFSSS